MAAGPWRGGKQEKWEGCVRVGAGEMGSGKRWDPPPSRGWEVELARETLPCVPGPCPQ